MLKKYNNTSRLYRSTRAEQETSWDKVDHLVKKVYLQQGILPNFRLVPFGMMWCSRHLVRKPDISGQQLKEKLRITPLTLGTWNMCTLFGFAVKTTLVNVSKLAGLPSGVNDRLMTVKLPLWFGRKHVFIVNVSAYAPTMTNPEEVKATSMKNCTPSSGQAGCMGDKAHVVELIAGQTTASLSQNSTSEVNP